MATAPSAPASTDPLPPTPPAPPVDAPSPPLPTVLVITNRSELQEVIPIMSWVDPNDSSKGLYQDSIFSSPGSHCPVRTGWFPDQAFMESRPMLGTYVRTA